MEEVSASYAPAHQSLSDGGRQAMFGGRSGGGGGVGGGGCGGCGEMGVKKIYPQTNPHATPQPMFAALPPPRPSSLLHPPWSNPNHLQSSPSPLSLIFLSEDATPTNTNQSNWWSGGGSSSGSGVLNGRPVPPSHPHNGPDATPRPTTMTHDDTPRGRPVPGGPRGPVPGAPVPRGPVPRGSRGIVQGGPVPGGPVPVSPVPGGPVGGGGGGEEVKRGRKEEGSG